MITSPMQKKKQLYVGLFFRAYYRANENNLTQKVLVYRDGVGGGEIQRVLEIELHGINVGIIL